MTNLMIIENKISAVKKYLHILDGYKNYSRKKIEEDINIRGALERYLYLAVQAAIDLAEATISHKNWRKPASMGETFEILKENKIISAALADGLIKMVGFRNIITHDYGEIDYDIVYDILQNKLEDIKKFLRAIKRFLS